MRDRLFDFSELSPSNPLLILDLANNHNGSLCHGKRIIDEIALATHNLGFKVAVKFQYRDLPNFIHPEYQNRRDLKYVDRFLSTQLEWDAFFDLRMHIRDAGLLAACTPFDEFSVKKVSEHNFDILKIASASFTDWSLLESITEWVGPIVGSTAGISLADVDRVVSFLSNRKMNFAIMHCVAAYPTKDTELHLSRIRKLITRYPAIPVGYSTHESPTNTIAGPLALAAGAVILERHVGSTSDGTVLNGYSSDVNNLKTWLAALRDSIDMMGTEDLEITNQTEIEALRGLRRYSFAARNIARGESLYEPDYFLAIPGENGQIQANDLGKYVGLKAKQQILAGESLSTVNLEIIEKSAELSQIRNQILDFIAKTNIDFPQNQNLEISHHYGLSKFSEFGVAMITLVNLDYCKKYLILLPGQRNPAHLHKEKDETFFVLHGSVWVRIADSPEILLNKGQTIRITPGSVHEFWTQDGCVVEELSTKHVPSDSYYIDPEIINNPNRKSFINYWMDVKTRA